MTQNKQLALRNNHNHPRKSRKSRTSRARARKGRWPALFLRTLARTPSISFAAKAAGVGRRTVYDLRERDPDFAARWDDALSASVDRCEEKAFDMAWKGDSQLLQFILKAHRASVYGDRARLDVGLLGGVVLIPAKAAGAE